MSNSLGYPNKKCTFAYRVVRRSKSQNISALALSLNRYHKSVTPSFQSDTQSDISFLIIHDKDSGWIVYGIYHKPGIFLPPSMRHAQKEVTIIIIYKSERTIFNVCLLLRLGRGLRWLEARQNDPLLGRAGR